MKRSVTHHENIDNVIERKSSDRASRSDLTDSRIPDALTTTHDESTNSDRPATHKRQRVELPLQENKRHKSQSILNPSSRCDQSGHFPVIDKSRRVRCKNENGDKKSYIYCIKCKIHLCVSLPECRNCFCDFHTIEAIESQENSNPIEQHKIEKIPDASLRFDQIGHFFKIDKSRLVRCKHEKCDKKSYIYCVKCNVHLCLNIQENRNCFTDFHIISNVA